MKLNLMFLIFWSVFKRKGKKVKILNTISKEIVILRSKKEAAKYLKADPASICNREKLFRGIYKIELLE
jgi:hypothetical protein